MDAVLNTIVNLVQFVQHIPGSELALLGAILAASGVQEVFTRTVENDTRTLKPSTNMAVTAAISGLVVAGDTFFSAAQANPNLLGVKEGAVIGGMTLAYRFAVKPIAEYLSKLLSDARTYRAQQDALKAAAVPAAAEVPAEQPATTDQAVG